MKITQFIFFILIMVLNPLYAQLLSNTKVIDCKGMNSLDCKKLQEIEIQKSFCSVVGQAFTKTGHNEIIGIELPLINTIKNAPSDVVVITAHGLYGSAMQFKYINNALNSAGVATINLILPGHGVDDHRANSIEHKDWIEEVDSAVKIAKNLGKKIVFMGQSTGGLLGYYAGLKYSKDIDSVILIEPAFKVNTLIKVLICSIGQIIDGAQSLSLLAKILDKEHLTEKNHSTAMGCEVAKLSQTIADEFTATQGTVCFSCGDSHNNYKPGIEATFPLWQIKTLVINNSSDEIVDPSKIEDFYNATKPYTTIDYIPKGESHGLHLPQEEILKFFKDNYGVTAKKLIDLDSANEFDVFPILNGTEDHSKFAHMNSLDSNVKQFIQAGYSLSTDAIKLCKSTIDDCDTLIKKRESILSKIFHIVDQDNNSIESNLSQLIRSDDYKDYRKDVDQFQKKIEEQKKVDGAARNKLHYVQCLHDQSIVSPKK